MSGIVKTRNTELTAKVDLYLPFVTGTLKTEVNWLINVQKIARVYSCPDLTKLPGSCAPFESLFEFETGPVPVMDLNKVLGNEPHHHGRLLVCHMLGYFFGVIVERTRKLRKIAVTQIEAPPQVFDKSLLQIVSGVICENDHYQYIIDLEALLSQQGIDISKSGTSKNATLPTGEFLKGHHILVVDDSKLYQQLLSRALKARGATVDVAATGKEGLDKLLTPNHNYELIFLDIEMPVMTGIEMAQEYRSVETTKPVPIIFHSSLSNPALIESITNSGLGQFLNKFNEENILVKAYEMLALPQQSNANEEQVFIAS